MALLAHILDNEGGGSTGLAIISIAAMIIPFVGLGFLARFFLKAGREDEDATGRPAPPTPDPRA